MSPGGEHIFGCSDLERKVCRLAEELKNNVIQLYFLGMNGLLFVLMGFDKLCRHEKSGALRKHFWDWLIKWGGFAGFQVSNFNHKSESYFCWTFLAE